MWNLFLNQMKVNKIHYALYLRIHCCIAFYDFVKYSIIMKRRCHNITNTSRIKSLNWTN